jgi:hypothetical protein
MPGPDDSAPETFWLRENPFSGHFQMPLLPENPGDLDRLYAFVDGFKHIAVEIDKWTNSLGQRRIRPIVALISGPRGSGRSSAARYLAYRCAAALKGRAADEIKPGLLQQCLVEVGVADEHPIAPAASLLSGFFDLAINLGIDMGEALVNRVLNISSLQHSSQALANLYSLMRTPTKGPIRDPIFCLEHVRNFGQISAAAQVFRTDAILICTTTLPSVVSDFSRENQNQPFTALQFDLSGLAPDDVVDLVAQRWKFFAKGGEGPAPIERTTIETTFTNKWPLRGVVIVLDQLLSDYFENWAKLPTHSRKPISKEQVQECMIEVLFKRGREFVE